jgi:predicted aspartyl protease
MLGQVRTDVQLGDLSLDTVALVSDEMPEIYLGLDWIKKHGVNWDFVSNEVKIRGRRFVMSSKGEL